jgi:hypothetical protein
MPHLFFNPPTYYIFNPQKLTVMKKVIFFLFFILTAAAFAHAQNPLTVINSNIGTDVMKAKADIDNYIANPKYAEKPEGWYYKGKVYNEISKHDSLSGACADCKWEAFNSFKKYQQLDQKNKLMAPNQNVDLFDIYNGYFKVATIAYEQKNYTTALRYFQKASMVEDYIRDKEFKYKGFQFPALDTLLIIDMGISARVSGNDNTAIIYYKMITDANLADSQYVNCYEYVTDYYKKTEDWDNFDTALAKGKKMFPDDKYWATADSRIAANNVTIADNTTTTTVATTTNNSSNTKVISAHHSPLEDNLSTATAFYTHARDNTDAIKKVKGWETADFQKRARLKDSATAAITQAIPYAQKAAKGYEAMGELNGTDKTNYIQSLTLLQKLYTAQHNATKAAEYQSKLDALNGNTPVEVATSTTTTTTITDAPNKITKEVTTKEVSETSSISSTSDANLSMEQSFYKKSSDYLDAVKKAKGWETADFQKRKKLKDSADAAAGQAITYGEAEVKKYEATPLPNDDDKANYTQAVTILQKIYTSKKDAAKAAEYGNKLSTLGTGTTVSTNTVSTTVNTTVNTPMVTNSTPVVADGDLSMEQSFYKKSNDYLAAIKKTKGWETADFQKRKKLKDSADAATDQVINYGEAVVKKYEANPTPNDNDKANYTQALTILQKTYVAKKDVVKASECDEKLSALKSGTPIAANTNEVSVPTTTTDNTPVVNNSTPASDDDLSTAQSLYTRSCNYTDAIKKVKGWETADFQKRKKLKDSADAVITQAIPYAETAEKKYEAMTDLNGTDKTNYIQSLTLLQKLYTAQHNATKAAEYETKLKAATGNDAATTYTNNTVVTLLNKKSTGSTTSTTTTTTTSITTSGTPKENLLKAESFYNSSSEYAAAIKKAKGWETADFQKRKKLKEQEDAATDQAIPYGEAAAKGYEAMTGLSGTDKADYIQSLTLLQKLYTAKHDEAKAAEYEAKLKTAQ